MILASSGHDLMHFFKVRGSVSRKLKMWSTISGGSITKLKGFQMWKSPRGSLTSQTLSYIVTTTRGPTKRDYPTQTMRHRYTPHISWQAEFATPGVSGLQVSDRQLSISRCVANWCTMVHSFVGPWVCRVFYITVLATVCDVDSIDSGCAPYKLSLFHIWIPNSCFH